MWKFLKDFFMIHHYEKIRLATHSNLLVDFSSLFVLHTGLCYSVQRNVHFAKTCKLNKSSIRNQFIFTTSSLEQPICGYCASHNCLYCLLAQTNKSTVYYTYSIYIILVLDIYMSTGWISIGTKISIRRYARMLQRITIFIEVHNRVYTDSIFRYRSFLKAILIFSHTFLHKYLEAA